MARKPLFIDTGFSARDASHVAFESDTSVFDFDVVIWDPQGTLERIELASGSYRGSPSPGEARSVSLRRALKRRKEEFEKFLGLGRTLVIFAAGPQLLWLDTGRREYSGTGRNRQTTNIVQDRDLLEALPVDVEVASASGEAIRALNESTAALLSQLPNSFMYRCTLDSYPGQSIAVIQGTDLVVGSLSRSEEGTLAILPAYWPGQDEDDWSYEAPLINDATELFLDWVESVSGSSEESRPSWFDEYSVASEVERRARVIDAERRLADVQSVLEKERADQAADEKWKLLLSASGEELERVTERAFRLLGFKELPTEEGRADLRLKNHDQLVVVEVKGLSKSAAERNAAQLEKWVAAEVEAGISAKGVLVVNGWRDINPVDRTGVVFPNQMLPYAEARQHCLVASSQLLQMVEVVRGDPSAAEAIREELVNTVGVMPGYELALERTVFNEGFGGKSA